MFQTIHAAAEAIRQERVTPLELLDSCLEQIDRWEAAVGAWVFVDREGARKQAARLTAELKRGQYRGPLHGIPLGVKDIFDVADWPTAAGSKLWAKSIARYDATVIDNLRRAGAVLLGKTVTTQYASFDPPVTRNPWNAERTPGGSSSGSAAAVATLMCLGATGSQTGGSLTRPASYCGIAALKPTFGLLPLEGIVPLAPSMDHPGPMGRCIPDLGLLLEGMAGEVGDSYGLAARPCPQPPHLRRLRGLFEERAEPAVRNMMDDVCKRFRARHATVSEGALPAAFAEVLPWHRTIMAVEAAAFHEDRLRAHPDDYEPQIRALVEEGLACPAPEYVRCRAHQTKLKDQMMWDPGEILLAPATPGPAPDTRTTGDPAFNSPWSYAGLPVVSFPTGHLADGLPLAIQLIGQAVEESRLLAAAAWCAQVLDVTPLNPPSP